MLIYWEKDSALIRDRVEKIISGADLAVDRKYKHCDYYYKLGCGFDIETSKVQLEDITISICYHWQFTIDYLNVAGRSLSSMLEFFKVLDSLALCKKARLLILDANLNYEFQFCKHYWKEMGISELFAKDIREPLRFLVGKSLFFVEVLGLFGSSLENIAENYSTVKKLKGDLNHDKIRHSKTVLKKKEMQYCENDTTILRQLGEYIFKNFFGNREKFPLTSTSRIRNKIKKKAGKRLSHIKKDIEDWMPSEKDYTILRNYLFKGGICGTNSAFMDKELNNVVCADYTSDYPAKCFHYKFPMGKCRRIEPTIDNIKKVLKNKKPFIVKVEFHKLVSTTTHSLMSSHKCLDNTEFTTYNTTKDNGRIFRADKCTLILNDIELLSFGYFNINDRTAYTFDRKQTKILQMWVFDYYGKLPEHVLSEIEEEYRKKATLKVELKKHDDYFDKYGKYDIPFDKYMNLKIDYQDSKSAVNGIFGMMCTALYLDDLEFNGDIIDDKKDENNKIVKKPYSDAIQNLFLYPFWGFWITSYARKVLIDTIIRFPNVIVQYDTDSIYFTDDGSEEAENLKLYMKSFNNKLMKVNNILFSNDKIFEDLGCWDINSKPFINFKGLGSKRYMYENESGLHITVSGCRSVKTVIYNNDIYDEMTFHLIADENNLSDDEIAKVMKTIKIKSTLEYQFLKKKEKGTVFQYFKDELKIETEYSNKMCSKYVELDKIIEKCPSLKINVTDYNGTECEMEISSCVVLEPVEFNMGIKEMHTLLYYTVQTFIRNHPDSILLSENELIDTVIEKVISKDGKDR